MKSLRYCLYIPFLFLFTVNSAFGQQPETIRMYELDNSLQKRGKTPAYEINRSYIRLAPQISEAGFLKEDDRLELPLEERLIEYRIDRISHYSDNTYSVIARSLDNDEMLTYTVQSGRIHGSLHMHERGRLHQMKYDPVLDENYMSILDYKKLDILDCPGHELPEGIDIADAENSAREKRKASPYTLTDENVFIDLLILYTTKAKEWMNEFGGGADLFIAEALNQAQLALDNSEVYITFRLAHASETMFDEATATNNGTYEILGMLQQHGDGNMDEAHTLRDSYNADLVALVARINDMGGVANLPEVSHGLPNYAFSVTRVQQMDYTPVFAHELGHTLGNAHSRNQIEEPANEFGGLNNYSTGWRWTGNDDEGYASVMTYPDEDQNVPYFSNPDILYEGVPTGSYSGDFAPADNARSMNEIREVVANYDVIIDMFEGGLGSEADPFQIATAAQLNAMRYFIGGHFILMNDIDLGFDTGNSGGQFWNEGKGWNPIYFPLVNNRPIHITFQGFFNGNNQTIRNLMINRPDEQNIGLFVSTGVAAVIANVGLVNVDITGFEQVGGLIGFNFGTVQNSYTTGEVNGLLTSGGLLGQNNLGGSPGTIIESYSSVDIICEIRDCGGLVGRNWGGVIERSFATGDVTLTPTSNDIFHHSVGGLVGFNDTGTITNSYSMGSVKGNINNGGLAGRNSNGAIITNSYSIGSVEAESDAGGLVGLNEDSSAINNSYWNVETSGINSSGHGLGLTTAQMLQKSSFTGWDFDDIWAINENETYPFLKENSQVLKPAPLFLSTPINEAIVELPVDLMWQEYAGTESYQLQISQDSLFQTIAVDTSGIKTLSVNIDDLQSETMYFWHVRAANEAGSSGWSEAWSFTLSNINGSTKEIPQTFSLYQNYPNPFNPSTVISYQLPMSSEVQLLIFDITGREVAALVSGIQQAGQYSVTFDAGGLSSGVYIYQLIAGGFIESRKLLLIK